MTAAVDVRRLTVRFGDFAAVKDVSFSVPKGEIFGFLGANGAGKTTTIRVLCGLLDPSEGSAIVAGHDVSRDPDAVKNEVGYMSQKFTLYTDLTVGENLDFAAGLRKMDRKIFHHRVKTLFEFIQFRQSPRTLVRDLPGGLKQELSLVAAMLHDPDVIFLDEPTAGVAPASRRRFWELIHQLAKSGKTVFVTTHYMDEAEECQRVALMRAGELIALDSPAQLKSSTFPEPLMEIEATESAPKNWVDTLRQAPFVESLQPYGRRFHAVVSNYSLWEKEQSKWPGLNVRKISPSLEDVFIRLVEGKER